MAAGLSGPHLQLGRAGRLECRDRRARAPALALYAAGFFWTLGYDTIYAHQDKADDALVGIRSSARRLGDATVPWLWAFYGITLGLLALAAALAGAGPLFYLALALPALHFAWQIRTVDIDDPASCLRRFAATARRASWCSRRFSPGAGRGPPR